MAVVRILSWNIQVYGPNKYGRSVNGANLVNLVGAVVDHTQANILVIQEPMSSVAAQVGFSLTEAIQQATGQAWGYYTTLCRDNGDRESYGIFWRTDRGTPFTPTLNNLGTPVRGLSTLQFPNNFSNSHGRRAAYATFTTRDTRRNFTVTTYHAPPNARAIRGLQQLAGMPELYTVGGPAGARVAGRLLCGDYNLDVNVQPEYSWLTNPVPNPPPPTAAGEGAGCAAATNADTLLMSFNDANNTWGPPIGRWPGAAARYVRPMALDNVFHASPRGGGAAGHVVDVLDQIVTRRTGIREAAQAMLRNNGPLEAFPHSSVIPVPFSRNLSSMAYAFLLYRYAVSDHLPVSLSVTI